MSRILIATDAWHPQVNGVVRTLDTTVTTLRTLGHTVEVIEPSKFVTVAAPFYPEIRGALPNPGRIDRLLRQFQPDHVHIATEGTIGWQVRRACRHRGWAFTTSYHTRFPEYLAELAHVPQKLTYSILRRFHAAASRMMVSTPSLEAELRQRGFTPSISRWSRGVDLKLFYPRTKSQSPHPRPLLLCVGRVSYEKGIEDFLKLSTPGTKVVVGDGPARAELQAKYPDVVFAGFRKGQELAETYADADLFVFPSKTDTFGIVLIEALASGIPVAAYPVTGPIDIVTKESLGCLNANLGVAIDTALKTGDVSQCVAEGRKYTWAACTEQFLGNLVPVSANAAKSK
ncbi:glycosyltransferase family 1 protein [soil metagenome]